MLIDFARSEIQFKGNQCSFARGRVKGLAGHRSPVQQLPDQWPLSTPPVNSQAEVSVSTAGIDIPIIQLDQHIIPGIKEMMRQLQESMQAMQQDAARQAEFAARQA